LPNWPTGSSTPPPRRTPATSSYRGNTTDRGYGWQHQQERAKWAPKVATGTVICWRCRLPIQLSEPWDLGHDDDNRDLYRGPEHAACNRATKTHAAQRRRATRPAHPAAVIEFFNIKPVAPQDDSTHEKGCGTA
ncbi:hypothetical protein, partial [Mycobacterium kiyosense]|uniref:hypothetical protein n=1 Tax=Mycobacterium kiyosense TaxID=2871094 RepID=UPI002232919A